MKEKPKALGRGLSALLPTTPSPSNVSTLPAPARRDYFECAIEDVHPWREQPRKIFDGDKLKELAETIKRQGVVQPLVVRARAENEGGGFVLIAGERRWRAAQLAGLKSVPVVVQNVSAKDAFERSLVENLQRADLNPLEEAEAYERLIAEHSYTQEQVAERVGKDRTTVTNMLRLLKLPPPVRNRVASGELPMGHARALLGLDDAAAIERAAAQVISKGLSVRQTEELVRKERDGGKKKAPRPEPSASVKDLEARLQQRLGTKVRFNQKSTSSGTIEIEYASLDILDGILEKLLAN